MDNFAYVHEDEYTERKQAKPSETLPKLEEHAAENEWSFYSARQKSSYVLLSILKTLLFILLLYLFLLSLNFMSIGFTLVSGFTIKAGPVIKSLLANPFAALAVGVVFTALLQNATATTSIVISMVGTKIIPDVKTAIPIVMGSNIGTCVTNALIALTLADDPNEFKRAFSGSTLNDIFNLLTTAVILPVEIASGFLDISSKALTDIIPFEKADEIAKANFISVIVNPVCDLFILLDQAEVEKLLNGGNGTELARRCCSVNTTNSTDCLAKCSYWCIGMIDKLGDGGTGLFWIILSIVVLIASLFGIVKVLSLLIVGPIAHGVNKALNASLPGRLNWFTEVLLFFISLLLTLVVQSSNIVTATLVPLCGIGIVTLQRVYVLTLGSNIGTTITGILTAFTQPVSAMKNSLQLAFVYTFFNSLGVLLWLPLPPLRLPIMMSRMLGNIALQYRWFVVVYVAMVYFIIPMIVFGLALIPNWIGLAVVGIPLILLAICVLIVKILRAKMPKLLPEFLIDFHWLPECLRSLKPLDRVFTKISKFFNRLRCSKRSRSITLETHTPENPIVKDIVNEITHKIPGAIRRISVVESIVDDARVWNSEDAQKARYFESSKL